MPSRTVLKSGKHVLVEKPAFINPADWDDMLLLAKKEKRLLVETMKFTIFPAYQELKRFIIDHHIKINTVEAAFGNTHVFDPTAYLFNPRLSVGATLDVGVYGL